MNYYGPKQRKDGKWDYTVRGREFIAPVGYCAGFRPLEASVFTPPEAASRENARMEPFRIKYHEHGHETPEQAQACYREYLLDQTVRFETSTTAQHKCKICGDWTPGVAIVDGSYFFYLCNNHSNREELEKLFPTVGESWES